MKFKKILLITLLLLTFLTISSVSANDNLTVIDDDILQENSCEEIELIEDISEDVVSSSEDEIIGATDNGTFTALQNKINSASENSTITLENDYVYDEGFSAEGINISKSLTLDGKGYTIDAKSKSRVFYITSAVTLKNLTIKNADSRGAVYFTGSGNIINCNFTNNTAFNGGAVCFDGTGNVTNCKFTNNTASEDGGAIKLYSGTVENCNFTNNTASYDGGAICFSIMGNVKNCNFNNNKATGDYSSGGAISFKHSGSVENCNFTNNHGIQYGGAIRFDNNGDVTNCNFINNSESASGGAIYFSSTSTGIIKNCNFINNTAPYEGGAIGFWRDGEVTNCNFTNNQGGAVYFEKNGTVTNCNFTDNTGPNMNGGAVCICGDGKATNCKFTNNKATTDSGGAIAFYSNGEATNCVFINNTAGRYGGAIFIYSGSVANCNFTNNTASHKGGAVHLWVDVEVTNCNFANNKATDNYNYGGAVSIYETGEITNCNFTNNTAFNGGAVCFDGTGNVTNCNFTNNRADDSGGAVYFYNNGEVTNCNFTNNSAKYCCAIYFQYEFTGTVENCNFINNTAGYISVISLSSGTVENCNFTNNTAKYGGTIYFDGTGTVTNCNFANNHATKDYSYGGAIRMYSGTVENCNFTNNTAKYGGAIGFDGNGTVINCNFVNNTASEDGGAIRMYSGTVENCNFTNNIATTGSAIHFYDYSSTKSISNSTFLNNRANADTNTPLNVTINENNITITFTGQNNLLNAIYSTDNAEVTFNNVTYWGANGITTISSTPSRSNKEAGQNITIAVVVNDEIILNEVKVTDENGTIILDVKVDGDYYIRACHDEDSYYTEAKTILTNMKFYVNVTETKTTNKTVNITAKSNIPNDIIEGKLLFILPNGDEINATYTADGIWWAVHTFDDYTDYQVNASYIGLSNVTINNATISITKANSTVNVSDVVLDYRDSENVTVTAEGATGITAKINDTHVTVVNNFTIPISGLATGNYTLTVTTIPDDDHNSVTKTVNITVNKAGTEITLTNEILYLKASDIVSELANLTPADAGNLTFQSSNDDIAIVTDGAIYARVKGNVTVTVSFAGNDNYAPAENKTITVYVTPKDASVSVENKTLDLNVDEKYEFNPIVNPSFLAVQYSSSNKSVVTVTDYGLVHAVGEGTAIITLTVGNNQTYAINTTNVTVTVSLNDASVSVNNSTLDLFVDDTFTVVATTVPAGLNVTYVVDDSGVYTVDEYGVVTALKEGTGSILVKVGGDGVYAENSTNVTVTVSKIPAEITVDHTSLDLSVGDEAVIGAALTPAGAGNVTFTSSNDTVVSVDAQGNVIAQGKGQAIITVSFAGDNKYAAVENRTVTVTVRLNDASITVDNDTLDLKVGETYAVNATKNPDTILLDITYTSSNNAVATVDKKGIVTAVGEGTAIITVEVGDDEIYAKNSTNVTVTVSKIPTEIVASAVTTVYNKEKNLIVTLKDADGSPISDVNIKIDLNGAKTYTTDKNGQVKVSTKGLATKTYTAKITFNGNDKYKRSTKDVKVTVKKATPKLTAKAKTFKKSVKTKKYSITLKDNLNKVMKNIKVSIKIKGKTYTAKTNSKGKATFKIKNLKKKGTYKATVTFKGNGNYNKVTKTVKIKVK